MQTEATPRAGSYDEPRCRLCAGSVTERFTLRIVAKYEVRYYQCGSCHSLQTEEPFWLAEAYAHNLSNLDTGAAQRNLDNLAAGYAIAKIFGLRNAIDLGGGDGLLCRLLRDYGINCFVRDKYARPTYAQGFTEPDFLAPDLVCAFEMLEHLAHPDVELDQLFELQPQVILATTGFFTTPDPEWIYLAPESGQHVFFYSRTALEFIAAKYGYGLLLSGGFIVFARKERLTWSRSWLARILLERRVRRLISSLLMLSPTPGVWADHHDQKRRSARRHVTS